MRKNHTIIEMTERWEQPDNEHFAPGVVVRVQNGLGTLREVYGNVGYQYYYTLMLGNQPLFQLQGEDCFCPTCKKILKSGYGLEQPLEFRTDKLNQSKEDVTFDEAVAEIAPIMGLLPSGYYAVIDTSLYPTDGNGHLFWDIPNEDQFLPGTCLYYYGDGEWGNLRPYFTVATQPKEKYSKERMEYYRKHQKGRVLAYYMDGYMTALLDGHHKALAAAMEHQKVNALVIMPGSLYHIRDEKGKLKEYLRFGDISIPYKRKLSATHEIAISEKVSATQMTMIAGKIRSYTSKDYFDVNTKALASYYPTVAEVADIDRAGTITEDLLDRLLRQEVIYTEKEACILISALSGLRHERFFEMGKFFVSQPYSGTALYTILEIMKKLPRDEELEQFFIEKMVEFEDDYPEIGKMILKYL